MKSFFYINGTKTTIPFCAGLLSISTELDREDTEEFRLNVSAQDHGHPQRQSFSILTISVFDVNDNPPAFEHSVYNATVEENLPLHSSVITISATDSDFGAFLPKFCLISGCSFQGPHTGSLNEHIGGCLHVGSFEKLIQELMNASSFAQEIFYLPSQAKTLD